MDPSHSQCKVIFPFDYLLRRENPPCTTTHTLFTIPPCMNPSDSNSSSRLTTSNSERISPAGVPDIQCRDWGFRTLVNPLLGRRHPVRELSCRCVPRHNPSVDFVSVRLNNCRYNQPPLPLSMDTKSFRWTQIPSMDALRNSDETGFG